MSANTPIPPLPFGDGDDPLTREVDGGEVVDEDANDDLIDSAEADRLAAEAPVDES